MNSGPGRTRLMGMADDPSATGPKNRSSAAPHAEVAVSVEPRRAATLDPQARYVVHPRHVFLPTYRGLCVAAGLRLLPLDHHLASRQEHDRLAAQHLTRSIPLSGTDLDLVARLAPRSTFVADRGLDEIADGHADVRAGLLELCDELVAGGLLVAAADADFPVHPDRLGALSEATRTSSTRIVDDDQALRIRLPIPLVPDGSSFTLHAHDGTPRVRLTPAELRALSALTETRTLRQAVTTLLAAGVPTEPDSLREAVNRLAALDLVEIIDRAAMNWQALFDPDRHLDRSAQRYQEILEERSPAWSQAGAPPTIVVPVDVGSSPSLSLGMLVAYA